MGLVQEPMGLILKAAQILHISLYAWDSVFSFFSNLNGYRFTLTHIKPSSLFYFLSAAAAAKSLQSCPTLCDPIDSSPPGSAVPGILQARMLEGVAISFSNAWKWKGKVKSLSCVRLFTDSSRPHGLQPTRLLCPWDYPGKNTGVDCHSYSLGSSRPRHQICLSGVCCTGRQILCY